MIAIWESLIAFRGIAPQFTIYETLFIMLGSVGTVAVPCCVAPSLLELRDSILGWQWSSPDVWFQSTLICLL